MFSLIPQDQLSLSARQGVPTCSSFSMYQRSYLQMYVDDVVVETFPGFPQIPWLYPRPPRMHSNPPSQRHIWIRLLVLFHTLVRVIQLGYDPQRRKF